MTDGVVIVGERTSISGSRAFARALAAREYDTAAAIGERQIAAIGEQGGGRVWLFLETEDFENDLSRLQSAGAIVEGEPRDEPYGRVVVWRDPFGNRWDLIEYASPDRSGN